MSWQFRQPSKGKKMKTQAVKKMPQVVDGVSLPLRDPDFVTHYDEWVKRTNTQGECEEDYIQKPKRKLDNETKETILNLVSTLSKKLDLSKEILFDDETLEALIAVLPLFENGIVDGNYHQVKAIFQRLAIESLEE